ncbi:protein TRACHEARY ELEMENT DIFFERENTIATION-RELATED 7A-like [Telopea speciosissima]|uniref:protein TRACHEARY ELEMENT DIFFERENTIATION-RELATED 7A-like n=1 Tax=Telopea speciosissima TaxID=54955 RepID=UPI001CC47AF3|nr:protein TRACHEARY ELEMENT DIFFERENTIATION-RELATED 7A-like [Telopea speciosissima]
MPTNIAKRAIPLYSATNAVPLVTVKKHLLPTHSYLSVPPPPHSWDSTPHHLHFVKGKVAAAHDPSESDLPTNIPPEIPSVPAYAPSFPPEVPGPNTTPWELEPMGPEIVPDPVPKKPPLAPPGGPDFPGPPTPSPPGPDIPFPPPPNTVPPPPPEVVPPRPPEIMPPPPNMPPDITPPPTGPFAVAGRETVS